ncbi:hypothetical protein H2203_008028 [Taxawa tesnikishii (nom. ined.)]|nr:hypothetical protein H2203_008028 [Dothideales sp. JES 119]
MHDLTIGDCPSTVPYNSSKRTLPKQQLEIFKYKFTMPATGTEYIIMWDYNDGLVRMTPFFRSLGHQKTVPNKAIRENPGLNELSHSITGGKICTQGYWMDFGCAYAVCQTFCWEIRWALTPIFGPAFIKDCLPPSDPNFKKFKVDSEVIRVATAKAEGRWGAVSRAVTPETIADASASAGREIPRSVPTVPLPKALRTRKPKNLTALTELDSPFQSDADGEDSEYVNEESQMDSPMVSPRTTPEQRSIRRWTPINGRENLPSTPPPSVTGNSKIPEYLPTPCAHPDSPQGPIRERAKGKKRALSPLLSDPDYSSSSASSSPATVSDASSTEEETEAEPSAASPSQRGNGKRAKKYHAREYNCALTLAQLSTGTRMVDAANILLKFSSDENAVLDGKVSGRAERRAMSE